MAIIFQTSDIILPGVALSSGTTPSIVEGGALYVTEGTSVVSTGLIAIFESVSDYTTEIHGTVLGNDLGLGFSVTTPDAVMDQTLIVGATGQLTGVNSYGALLYGVNGNTTGTFDVVNAGTISSYGIGALVLGGSTTDGLAINVTNTGHIFSTNANSFPNYDSAVRVDGAVSGQILNTGLIEAAAHTTSGFFSTIAHVAAVSVSFAPLTA